MTYAGHAVWNQTNARVLDGGYVGSSKRRPRSEWQIQRDTHEALITEEEADAIVSRLEKRTTTRMRGDDYLLSGLLQSPAGKRWHGDQGFYRCGRRRLSARRIEQQVIDALSRELMADGIIKQAAKLAREGAAPGANEAHVRALRREIRRTEPKDWSSTERDDCDGEARGDGTKAGRTRGAKASDRSEIGFTSGPRRRKPRHP